VGFDNVPMTELTTPGLTTMAMPMSELGDAAARLLDANIRLGADHLAVRETFSAQLVARASTLGYAEGHSSTSSISPKASSRTRATEVFHPQPTTR